jgi:hypothetical protein
VATTPERWLELAADSERRSAEARAEGDDELADRLLHQAGVRRQMAELEGRLGLLGLTDPMDPAKLASATLLRGIGPEQATAIIDEVERLRTQLGVASDDPVALQLYEGAGHALMGADYRDHGAMLLARARSGREIDLRPLARLARLDDEALAQAAGTVELA